MFKFVLLILLLMPVTSLAEEVESISPVCQLLTVHTPTDDVAYKPGVDVNGNAVVPTDLNPNTFAVPDVIKVPLDINLAERLPNIAEGVQLEAPLGMLEIYSDGKVQYNGKDWTAPVMTVCGQSHKVEPEAEPSGQTSEDVIKSEKPKQIKQEVNIGQIEVDPPVEEESVKANENKETKTNE